MSKYQSKLIEYIEYTPDDDQYELIAFNVGMFKKILNRSDEPEPEFNNRYALA